MDRDREDKQSSLELGEGFHWCEGYVLLESHTLGEDGNLSSKKIKTYNVKRLSGLH